MRRAARRRSRSATRSAPCATEVQPQTPLAAVQAVWPEAVGERIAAEARPVRERDGTVTVECRAATWAQELDLLHDELLERLNEALGSERAASADGRRLR